MELKHVFLKAELGLEIDQNWEDEEEQRRHHVSTRVRSREGKNSKDGDIPET